MTLTEPPKYDRASILKAWAALPVGGALAYWHDKLDFGAQTTWARQSFMALARTWPARLHVKCYGGRVVHVAVKVSEAVAA